MDVFNPFENNPDFHLIMWEFISCQIKAWKSTQSSTDIFDKLDMPNRENDNYNQNDEN
jgi:hypothetical protein